MITESQIYWITRLDNVIGIAIPVTILGIIALVLFVISKITGRMAKADGDENVYDRANALCKTVLPFILLLILSIPTLVFVPTTKEMCAIKVIPVIANNEKVQELPNKIVELANEWAEELKPKKTEK